MVEDKLKTVVESVASELLSLMGSKAKIEVKEDKDNDAFLINLDSGEETGLLIGRHGETIASIQTIVGMAVRQKVGEWVRVIVNVGDYREKQEDQLKDLATQAAERVKETGEPQYLYNLTPSQRRVVHLFLSEDEKIKTESQGEGRERFLVISKK